MDFKQEIVRMNEWVNLDTGPAWYNKTDVEREKVIFFSLQIHFNILGLRYRPFVSFPFRASDHRNMQTATMYRFKYICCRKYFLERPKILSKKIPFSNAHFSHYSPTA